MPCVLYQHILKLYLHFITLLALFYLHFCYFTFCYFTVLILIFMAGTCFIQPFAIRINAFELCRYMYRIHNISCQKDILKPRLNDLFVAV